MGKNPPYAEWTEERKARHLEYSRWWREQNQERARGIARQSYERHAEDRKERARQYYAENREQERERNKQWHRDNPEKSAAWNARKIPTNTEYNRRQRADPEAQRICRARDALNNAVKGGHIIRPDACSQCGIICTPHGHHPDYSKPLEVIWLCPPCHVKEHHDRTD